MKDNTRFTERLAFLFQDIKPYLIDDDVWKLWLMMIPKYG